MFKFFKEKIKDVVSKLSKDVEEEGEQIEEEVVEEQVVEQPKKKSTPKKKKEKKKPEPTVVEEEPEVPEEAEKPEVPEAPPESEKSVAPEQKQVEISEPEEQPVKEKVEEPEVVKEEVKKLPPEPKDEEPVPEPPKAEEKKKGFFSRVFGKKEDAPEDIKEEEPEEVIAPEEQAPKEKKSILSKITKTITKTKLKDEQFESLFFDLEIAMMENNVAVQVIEKIKDDLKEALVKEGVQRGKVEQLLLEKLQASIREVLDIEPVNFLDKIQENKPYVVMALGVNGSGKTTSLAKLAHYLQQNGKTVVIAAADTFRAAAIQQMQEHTDKLGVKLIKHDYGADPAAVAYDAVEHAKSKGVDVVLIDTAGRLHSNSNLMQELKKIEKVAQPHFNIFVGESITGNDCVDQVEQFGEFVNIDGIILTKADVDEKGGAALSISYVTQKPILFLGMGQTYDDLKPYDKKIILDNLGL